jgi:hypothetical protein
MICTQCDSDLAACTCPNLEERFQRLCQSEFLLIGSDYAQRIKKQIERNKQRTAQQKNLSE